MIHDETAAVSGASSVDATYMRLNCLQSIVELCKSAGHRPYVGALIDEADTVYQWVMNGRSAEAV